MSPVFRTVLLTVLYWPIALVFLGLMLLPECFGDASVCEASKRTTALAIFGGEVALYIGLLFAILRGRTRTYWIVVTAAIAVIVALYLTGLGIF